MGDLAPAVLAGNLGGLDLARVPSGLGIELAWVLVGLEDDLDINGLAGTAGVLEVDLVPEDLGGVKAGLGDGLGKKIFGIQSKL